MNKIAISELLLNNLVQFTGNDWTSVDYPPFGGPILRANGAGAVGRLRVPPEVSGLWFLRHAWSGKVVLKYDGRTEIVELTDPGHDLDYYVPISQTDGTGTEIKIIAQSSDDPLANGSEVWLLGAVFENLPKKPSKTLTLSRSTRLIEGRWGDFLVLNTDRVVPEGIIEHGVWAGADVELFKAHISAGQCVLDIGAHIGHHTVVFSKLVGPDGLVLAVEAQRHMYQLLNANCVINSASNVRPVHAAASDHRHYVWMDDVDYNNAFNFGSLGINVGQGGRSKDAVEGVCVDDLVGKYCGDRNIDFIKIDVQSYEKFALRGLQQTIERYRPKIFLEVAPLYMHKAGYDYRELYRMLFDWGYKVEHFMDLKVDSEGIPDYPFDYPNEWDAFATYNTSDRGRRSTEIESCDLDTALGPAGQAKPSNQEDRDNKASNESGDRKKVVIIHVPKSAGTSVTSALRKTLKPQVEVTGFSRSTFGPFDKFETVAPFERSYIINGVADLNPDADFVGGHIDYKISRQVYGDHRFLLIAREARSRLLSQWLFWRARPDEALTGWGQWAESVRCARMDFNAFIGAPEACSQTDNAAARLLLHPHHHIPLQSFIDPKNYIPITRDLTEVLASFDFVDFVENFELANNLSRWLNAKVDIEVMNSTTPPAAEWQGNLEEELCRTSIKRLNDRTRLDDFIWETIVRKVRPDMDVKHLRQTSFNATCEKLTRIFAECDPQSQFDAPISIRKVLYR